MTPWTVPVRAAIVIAFAVAVAGCFDVARPTPVPVVWDVNVPEAPPEAVASQPVVARGPNSITLLPISPTGALVGRGYGYAMPHCGINSPIDVDGSFWDAVGVPPTSVDFDGWPGTFQLTSHTEAIFTASDGRTLRLIRHTGAKAFRFCF